MSNIGDEDQRKDVLGQDKRISEGRLPSWAELRQWQQSFSLSPALSQTKPPSTDIISSASLATDECDRGFTADNDASDLVEEKVEAADKDPDYVEDVHEVLNLIARKEKTLLNIWECGPAQLTLSQDMRIKYLEEKLEKADEDNKYLEALLEVRNADFARYHNLHWKEKIEGENLAERVDSLLAEMKEKDQLINSMEAKLDCMREAEKISKELIVKQKQLAKSTLALVCKQRKTKMASTHSVQYTATRPRPPVQEEIAMAERREWERRKEEQKKDIVAMVNHVDRIAAGFDRYQNISTVITCTESRSEVVPKVVPDHLFTWVDKDMIASWLFSMEPTQDEKEKYEKHLQQQMRPDPIYSPTLMKPRVNWSKLNTNMLRNLPIPTKYAVQSCAQDPEFYSSTKDVEHHGGQILFTKLVFESSKPFGSLYGFWTSQGVLAPPEEAVHGYHCCTETGTWVIAAEGG